LAPACISYAESIAGREQNRFNMQNKKLIRFVQSFILLPFMTTSMPVGNVSGAVNSLIETHKTVLFQNQNIELNGIFAFNQAEDQKANTLKLQADAIDAYFSARNMPLAGYGMKMAEEAEKNGLDWRLLPAIAVRESTGGKHACKKVTHSFFGWGSCKIGFNSPEEAIEIVAKNIGGNDEDTAHHYYGKDTEEILNKYNPPSIVRDYTKQVLKIMDDIGDKDLGIDGDFLLYIQSELILDESVSFCVPLVQIM
jgi:hypothetical protein